MDSNVLSDTITPFGRAYYRRSAPYFVYPYSIILLLNFTVASLSAVFWATTPISTAQILRLFLVYFHKTDIYASKWFRTGVVYGLIAMCFIVLLTVQSVLAILWVVVTKWIVIGRRKEGSFSWDASSYCEFLSLSLSPAHADILTGQRWQTHLTLSRPLNRGRGIGGVLAPLTGSAYIVW